MKVSHFIVPSPSIEGALGQCCVCGWKGNRCLPKHSIMSKSTGGVSNLCPLPTDEICAHCAALWAEPKVYARSIWVTTKGVQFPMISPDPEGKRPTWRNVIQSCEITQERVAILSTDPKKRVWPYAQISQGETLSLYLHDPSRGISENRSLNIYQLQKQLTWIEDKMTTYEFSKVSISDTLLKDLKTAQKIGVEHCMVLEQTAQAMRSTPEFIPALIIAQKQEVVHD